MNRPMVAHLADGREILFFALSGRTPHPVVDHRPLPSRENLRSQLRFDRLTGQWTTIAAFRQDRTYKPPADQCPLCPDPSGDRSEVPAPDYDVVVFENRFPSLSLGMGDNAFQLPDHQYGEFAETVGYGRCEVICFSSDHMASFGSLNHDHARLVVEAWAHRTSHLLSKKGIAQVFCFENRGEEIGVTLTHPHGQIYAYPFLTPRTENMFARVLRYAADTGRNLFADNLVSEIDDGSRIVTASRYFTAFVPFAAKWPVEVHVYPNRQVHNLTELSDAELDDFTGIYLDVLRRCDRLYSNPLPYISALHQYKPSDARGLGYFHLELMSIRRSASKLKFLAGSESAMDAFISDVTPEAVAQRLRDI